MVFDSTDTEIQYNGKDMEEAFQMGVDWFMEKLKKYKASMNCANYPWNYVEEAYRDIKKIK